MAEQIQDLLREIFGDSFDKVTKFQTDQLGRITSRLQDMAREAMKPEITRLSTEISELRSRIADLELERARAAVDGVEPSI